MRDRRGNGADDADADDLSDRDNDTDAERLAAEEDVEDDDDDDDDSLRSEFADDDSMLLRRLRRMGFGCILECSKNGSKSKNVHKRAVPAASNNRDEHCDQMMGNVR